MTRPPKRNKKKKKPILQKQQCIDYDHQTQQQQQQYLSSQQEDSVINSIDVSFNANSQTEEEEIDSSFTIIHDMNYGHHHITAEDNHHMQHHINVVNNHDQLSHNLTHEMFTVCENSSAYESSEDTGVGGLSESELIGVPDGNYF